MQSATSRVNEIAQLTLRFQSAQSQDCRRWWARQVIEARFAAGEFPMLQELDAVTMEYFIQAMLRGAK